jgi:Arc/MetJ-type ribon-helix-helix transcriptional regulator
VSGVRAKGKLTGVRLRDEERKILEKFKEHYGLSYTDAVRFALRRLDEEEGMIKEFLHDLTKEIRKEVKS